MVEVAPRSLRKRKLSHSQSRPARSRPVGKSGTGVPSTRRIRPRPPRTTRTRDRAVQALSHAVDVNSEAGPNVGSSVSAPSAEPNRRTSSLPLVKSFLDKIWARNKNQHRNQPWWKTLSMLRKAVARLSGLGSEERLVQAQAHVLGSTSNAQDVRKRFDRETQLRREQEVWRSWIRQVLVPKAYLGFSSLVGDVQFANLGVVLIGLLADVVSIVGSPTGDEESGEGTDSSKTKDMRGRGENFTTSKMRTLMATSLKMTGPQSGELVERQYDSDDLGEIVERDPDLSLAALPSSKRTREDRRLEGKTKGSKAAVPHTTSENNEVSGEELDGGKNNSAKGSDHTEERRMTKSGNSAIKAKKSKNRIDDLFAGLT